MNNKAAIEAAMKRVIPPGAREEVVEALVADGEFAGLSAMTNGYAARAVGNEKATLGSEQQALLLEKARLAQANLPIVKRLQPTGDEMFAARALAHSEVIQTVTKR